MIVNNYDIKADAYLSGVGYITEKGSYAGEYMAEAYDILGIEGELEDCEWCDICIDNKGQEWAVCGDTEAHNFGNFYFKRID